MKKILVGIISVIIVILLGTYLSRNYIIKKVLENKLTEINKGKVDIGSVNFSPFDKRIVINDIGVTSRKDGMKNFVSIGKFETDYDLYFKEKKVLVNRAVFDGVEFMTPRSYDGNTGYVVAEDNSVTITSDATKGDKNSAVQDLEELIEARAMVNKMTLQNILQEQYEKAQDRLKEKKAYWNDKIAGLEKTKDYKILKTNYEKISKEKNPLKLLRMESEIKAMVKSFSNLSKEVLKDKENMKKDFKDIVAPEDMEKNLELAVNELVGKGEFVITDLDSIINYYLNEIYGEKIEKLVVRYRDIMRELELRRNEDMSEDGKWELFAEEIDIKSKIYGIELNGEIKNISSRLSKNESNIELSLEANSDLSHGKAYGYIELNKIQGKLNIDISNFNFKDLEDMETLNIYVSGGEAGLIKEVVLSRDNIDIKGDIDIHNMNLNGDNIAEKLNIKSPLLKSMLIPLLKDVNTGNIHYEYNSITGKLTEKSDLSKEIMRVLNDKNGAMKKKIAEDMLKEGKENIENYRKILDSNNQESLKELEKKIDKNSEYLEKVQNILDKLNIDGSNNLLNSILEKF